MDRYVTDEDLEELQECLTKREKNRIDGKGFFGKILKRFRDERQANNIEKYEAMINDIENRDISNIIPDEYKK